ncbi:hypothetical protein [Pleomorphomonas sp. PLEO]|uniref:hypothetical protein n=1 Tax=Pleomorphomonas sp. PLEO TaxID=3239306 RepID=UPI00351DFD8B
MTDRNSPSARVDAKLTQFGDGRGEALQRMRGLIREADPKAVSAQAHLRGS